MKFKAFRWRKITEIKPRQEIEVIAVKTREGFYKSKFGLSHNCDDL
jgi:hypothetical protein